MKCQCYIKQGIASCMFITIAFCLKLLLLLSMKCHIISQWLVPQSGNFLLVNTIDGRIHAFLLKCDNVLKYKWTFVLDEKQFEHNLNSLDFGERFLIPSLSGNLYSFDGKSLFQVHLPNNQPQINLDVSFSGGSTVNLYGIDFLSGEVVYKCVNGECST
ncbi:MAG: Eukaryotic translation initiation factor 2-alpha kinase 3, partial [Marteilia pararefringens]